jgi:hypothetical protein
VKVGAMVGVAVITPGVREGIGVQTGEGCVCRTSQAVSRKIKNRQAVIFFIQYSFENF